ncbi:hypothetical protein GF339_05485, partial [candidate division KSB3 bacterium]|nr:hypothetical protein [candidate division KSB3 bacterium]MBD3324015.1 hypothetical protein [candidate division KSB3 bacterium]
MSLKRFQRCGVLAIIAMLIFGTLLGLIGVLLAHIGMKYYPDYYLILIFPIVMALFLGSGLTLGAKIGRCRRFNLFVFLVVCVFSVLSYGALLFLNHYHDTLAEAPTTIIDEYEALSTDTQNFLAQVPYISDYITPADPEAEEHLWNKIVAFGNALPEMAFAAEPVVVGTIFDLALLAPIRDYLIYPGITHWDEDNRQLVFDVQTVQPWMRWAAELFLVWLIVLLKTRGATKKAQQRLEQQMRDRRPAPPGGALNLTPRSQPAPEPPHAEAEPEGKQK